MPSTLDGGADPTQEEIACIARVTHEANRVLQLLGGEPAPSPAWDDAPQWQRDSAIDGVRKALTGATPEQMHENWCAYKRTDGWRFGPIKDPEAKTHPCLVPYADLPQEQRRKDHLFSAIVGAMTADLGPRS